MFVLERDAKGPHFTSTEVALIKISVGRDVENLEPSPSTAGRNVKWDSCCGKKSGSF